MTSWETQKDLTATHMDLLLQVPGELLDPSVRNLVDAERIKRKTCVKCGQAITGTCRRFYDEAHRYKKDSAKRYVHCDCIPCGVCGKPMYDRNGNQVRGDITIGGGEFHTKCYNEKNPYGDCY